VDSPILVNTSAGDVYYKNPMFYYLGHFSKFIVPNSVRIGLESNGPFYTALETTAFLTPDRQVVVVVLNRDYEFGFSFFIEYPTHGYINNYIPPSSIQTYIFNE